VDLVGARRPPRRLGGRREQREPFVIGVDRRGRHAPAFAASAHRHRFDPDLVRIEDEPIEVPGRAQIVDLRVLERRVVDVSPERFAAVARRHPRHERREPRPAAPAGGRIVIEPGCAIRGGDNPIDVDRWSESLARRRDCEPDRRSTRRIDGCRIRRIGQVSEVVCGRCGIVRLQVRLCVGARGEHRQQHEHRDDDQPAQPRRLVACPRRRAYGPNVAATLTDNALQVLRARYLARDEGVVVETPEQLFARVARHVASAEARYGASADEIAAVAAGFERRMAALEFLPNSPTLMNAGRPLGQLAACFVVPVDDSTTGVFEAVRWAAEIQKTGGGTGFSFSRLRPAGDLVASTGGTASGPVTLMQVFDVATEAIKQGGTRRGANMGMLRVDHPDILEFIAIKLDPTRMRNFNLSVAATDAFMRAVAAGASYELVNPRTNKVTGRLDARRVFDAIANAAWAVGDPGFVFIDRVNDVHPTPDRGVIEATNPCGEQPLLPFESCTLGSIDVGRFVSGNGFDWDRLRDVIHESVRFLDDVIDANRYPLVEIERATRDTRKIGLGIMGWADALVALDIAYDSEPALELASKVARFLEDESLRASEALAAVRGPFPAWAGSRWERAGQRPLRNATTTTIAPTGTISIIAGCASGIEPLYALAYRRNVLDGAQLDEVNPAFRTIASARGIASAELFAAVAEHGGVRGVDGVPAEIQRRFPTAHDVSVEMHVRMQAAFQRYVHAAVSKTINLRREATPADVKAAYQLAYELGCKGITVYRDGSREGQVLVTGPRAASASAAPGCPECGNVLVMQARCQLCRHCGWSVCSV
jgi:ribonucleoside-diphosphate reductase alpha chain